MDLEGALVVVVGATSQVAGPLARALAGRCTVVGAARFAAPGAREQLEAAGVRCVAVDLSGRSLPGSLSSLPGSPDYVLNFAVAKTNEWEEDLDANCGGLAALMEHCAGARAFLHCSSTAVYRGSNRRVFAEDGPLGDSHAVWPFLRTYSISKIAAEATARWAARRYGLPTVIARLSVPYGDQGGWPAVHLEMMLRGIPVPVHHEGPSVYHPIHDRDIARSVPKLLGAASVPATTVNWGGDDPVSIEDWCTHLAALTGLQARFAPTTKTLASVRVDLERYHQLAGPSSVPWREGMEAMARALHPELFPGPVFEPREGS